MRLFLKSSSKSHFQAATTTPTDEETQEFEN